ncbi:MAG: hypothetical protein WC907_03540 [Acholeplasmataceae bacterium]
MEALFIVLNDLSFLDDILEAFIDLNVKGATILDSEGMAQAIMRKEGFFETLTSGPFYKSDQEEKYSKTIFTVLPDGYDSKKIIDKVKEVVSSSKRNVIGFMFTLPVSGVYPLKSSK